jgi:hypothetical protein
MAFSAKISANLISVSKLPEAVNKAVALAEQRVGAVAGPNVYVPKWDLIGRRLKKFEQGVEFADEVTARMGEFGIKAEPSVFKVGRWILAGYIEIDNLPQFRGF